MYSRRRLLDKLDDLFERFQAVALLGPRQVGKTTLARQLSGLVPESTVFDLEDPFDLARLQEPRLVLEQLSGLVVIDEIQLRPELFSILRVLVDRPGRRAKFLLLGSASPELISRSAETLAGRIAFLKLDGFHLDEVGGEKWRELLIRGGFPLSLLSDSDAHADEWRQFFVETFLTRDLPMFGVKIPSATLRRFWTLLAHYHGKIWNAAELSRTFGISTTSVNRYLDLLTSVFMVRQLPPFFENIGKRQVKAPKIYLGDSGLFHTLMGIRTLHDLLAHPKLGASWEGFAISEVVHALEAREDECFFWATHAGAELDLLVARGQKRRGFEFKFSEQPKPTKSMFIALDDLKLDRLDIIHPGPHSFPLGERLFATSIRSLDADLPQLDS